jgi:hypothetical protein
VLVRARYLREAEELAQVGAHAAVYEEAEAARALADVVRDELAGAGFPSRVGLPPEAAAAATGSA